MKYNILHTPSKVGVLVSIIFSHTPEEAMSGGLVKACVPIKIDSVEEKLSFLMKIKQNEKSTFIYEAGVWPGKYFSFAAMGKIGKENG